MMSILINDARQKVWCEPLQDYQHVIKLARLTGDGGSLLSLNVTRHNLCLPEQPLSTRKTFFHVYQIGQYSLIRLGLNIESGKWHNLLDVCYNDAVNIDCFIDSGTSIQRKHVYIQHTKRTKNILLAVAIYPEYKLGEIYTKNIYNQLDEITARRLDTEDLYIKFYSNAVYNRDHWLNETGNHADYDPRKPIQNVHRTIASDTDVTSLINQMTIWDSLRASGGKGYYLVDGFMSLNLHTHLKYVGRSISIDYDQSIYESYNFPIRHLPVFTSERDTHVRKYILLPDLIYDKIDYHDDVEVFLTSDPSSNPTTLEDSFGVRIPILHDKDLRNITHNAYSLRCSLVRRIYDSHQFLKSKGLENLYITLLVRKGGKVDGVKHQHNRIAELFRLNREQVIQALTGVNSVMHEWKASTLENSAYVRLMDVNGNEITEELVTEAYGYNYSTMLAVPPLHKVVTKDGVSTVKLEPTFMMEDLESGTGNRAVFTYKDGKLVNWFTDTHTSETLVIPSGTECDTVEVFQGVVSEEFDGVIYDDDIENHGLEQYGFRAYVSTLVSGVPKEDWTDVTGTAYYNYHPKGLDGNSKPKLIWNWSLLSAANLFPAVKINKFIHVYKPRLDLQVNSLNHRSVDGMLFVALNTKVTWLNTVQFRKQTLPPATLDVFVNGDNLIEGIDYFVKWPYIAIVKRFDTALDDTEVLLRTYGCGNAELKRSYPPREIGFVKDGYLSINGRYNTRNDRNVRIVSEGKIYDRHQVTFGEGDIGPKLPDGRPYGISDYILPVEGFTNKTTNEYRQKSLEVDERVDNYLSGKLPELQVTLPTIVGFKWQLYSPVCALLLHMFQEGYLLEETKSNFTSTQVDQWIQPVKYLLDYDPCLIDLKENYIEIFTHGRNTVITISRGQYRLLETVIDTYLNSKVQITTTVAISGA